MTAAHGSQTPTFDWLHRVATGHPPHQHRAHVAANGLPATIQVPAEGESSGEKSGLILAWLWRRLYAADQVRAGTARRLIWALPQRSLLEPLAAQVRRWLADLELTEEVALHVVTGARGEDVGDWRENMHLPAIVLGTADTLTSKALNRGYGLGQAMFPIDFALTVNGAHWVIDEPLLCPRSTTTLRQLIDFAGKAGTAEPFGLTLVSALSPPQLTFRRLDAAPGDYGAIAASALERHTRGTLTLVVLNTVDAAQQVYRQLRGGAADVTLLHSRFRGRERGALLPATADQPGDRIVVATQVVEAGIGDLAAALVITEAAPRPSLMLRARHRARTAPAREGNGTPGPGEVWWTPALGPPPGPGVVGPAAVEPAAVGPGVFAALFDTSTYLSGDDPGIAPYLRDAEDLDVEVAWATWTEGEDGAPDPEVRYPGPEYRCRVPVGVAVEFAQDRTVWRFDQGADSWTPVTRQPQSRPRPGELLLVHAADGGYHPELGFLPGAGEPVTDGAELLTPDEAAERAAAAPVEITPRRWQSLDEHSQRVRDQAAALLAVLAPSVPPQAAQAAILAGYLHDAGKAHPIWQDALCAVADDVDQAMVAQGRPWAKSGTTSKSGRLEFAGGPGFRHELASLLLLDGPLRNFLAASPDPDLTRFLVLAHHGRLRIKVRDSIRPTVPPNRQMSDREILGLEEGAMSDIPSMFGQPATTLTVDLGQFHPDHECSWTKTALALLGKYGPFTLAYLETVVRMADWRASGGRELPKPNVKIGETSPSMSPLKAPS